MRQLREHRDDRLSILLSERGQPGALLQRLVIRWACSCWAAMKREHAPPKPRRSSAGLAAGSILAPQWRRRASVLVDCDVDDRRGPRFQGLEGAAQRLEQLAVMLDPFAVGVAGPRERGEVGGVDEAGPHRISR
jgi:hypothetical protein